MTLPGGYRVNLGPAGGNGRIFVASAVVLTWARDGDLKFSQVGARQTASASVFGDGRFYTLSRVIERRSPGAFWMSAAAAARIGCGVGQRAARGTRPTDADGALTLIR